METAIITGTGIYEIPGLLFEKTAVDTDYGQAQINICSTYGIELAFLARHGLDHSTPPHRINYLANIAALKKIGVKYIVATNAVGSISKDIPPMALSVLTDFLDFTNNRPLSFFEGGNSGLAHTSMDTPYCKGLNQRILELSTEFDLNIYHQATYVATNGPRFETPAEIRMYEKLGGDLVGMTGVPEVVLAKELGMHYASVAYSINWAAGLEEEITFVSDQMGSLREKLTRLLLAILMDIPDFGCKCEDAVMMMHAPKSEG